VNGLHVALVILALLIMVGATAAGFRSDTVSRHAVPLIALGLAVWFLDLVLVAARVYG
jgi:uncharacterized membrane protein